MMANPVPGIFIRLIGTVLYTGDSFFLQEIPNLAAAETKNRTDNVFCCRPHGAQTPKTSPPAQIVDHGFCQILLVMGQGSADFFPLLSVLISFQPESFPAHQPACFLFAKLPLRA